MSLSSANQDNRLKRTTCTMIGLAGTLVLLTCLCHPDGLEGSGPGSKPHSVDSRRQMGSHHSRGLGRGGQGREIGSRHRMNISPTPPRVRRVIIQRPQITKRRAQEDPKVHQKRADKGHQSPPQQLPLRKLAKPQVPYLNELALDIDTTLRERVRRQPAEATAAYKDLLAATERAKDPAKEKDASTNLGHVFYLTGRFSQSVDNYSKALLANRRIGDNTGEAVSLRNLGAVFTAAGNFQEAENCNREALRFFQATDNTKGRQMTLNNLGVLEKNRARYSQALNWYEMALGIGQPRDKLRAQLHRNLGNFFRSWGEYEKAVQNYEISAAVFDSLGDAKQAGEVLLDAGQAYAQWGRNGSALESTKKALEKFTNAGEPTDWAQKLMGDILLDAGRLAEADP